MRGWTPIETGLRALATDLREDIPDLVERGLAQMRREMPEFFVRLL